jgi:hypothetical protein
LVALFVCLPGVASAQAPANDNHTGAITLADLQVRVGDTTNATTANPEPLTFNGNGDCNGAKMGRTIWYRVTARSDGGPLSVNTHGSDFDTIVNIYATNGTGPASTTSGPPSNVNRAAGGCSDDTNTGPFSLATSRARLATTVPNKVYLVQVGGFAPDNVVGADTGFVYIARGDLPLTANARSSPQDLTAGNTADVDNFGATEEPGEDLICPDPNDRPLASTVWFRYTAPAAGTATFISNGNDTVMQVYRGSDTNPIACQDDGGTGTGSRVSIPVTPGDYLVQVGGFAGIQNFFTISTEFQEDLDIDDDGSNRPADCNDGNSSIRPGAPEVYDNGVDENCNPGDDENPDRDGDQFNRPQDCDDNNRAINPSAVDVPGNNVDEDCSGADAVNLDADGDGIPRPRDCNDNRASVHPGARDIPGDRIDQDCSGSDARFRALILKYDFFFTASGGVRTLTAKVRRGATVRVTCRGRGCPGAKTYRSKGKKLNLARRFRRALGNGARIDIRATQRDWIGKVAQIKYFSGKAPTDRVLCIPPGSRRPQRRC